MIPKWKLRKLSNVYVKRSKKNAIAQRCLLFYSKLSHQQIQMIVLDALLLIGRERKNRRKYSFRKFTAVLAILAAMDLTLASMTNKNIYFN